VLRDGDTVIVEASAIIEYLAATQEKAAGLIPADPRDAVTVRMLDRVFDNYVMGTAQQTVGAYIADPENPDPQLLEAASTGLKRSYAWLEQWLGENEFPSHVSLATCAAAPSLFYADWVERIPEDCPRLAALRAELLALPSVSRCVEDARPYRELFPLGAPDRD
jgi:glutathione S-transferase